MQKDRLVHDQWKENKFQNHKYLAYFYMQDILYGQYFFNSDFKFDDDFINQFLLILKSMITVSAIFVNQMKSKEIRGIIER